MAQIPTDERRFKAPKVTPTVSVVRPTGTAPQGKLGSPSAVGFNPAYTATVQPRPENKGFTAAATTPPKSFFPTKEFWADPTGYGQPLYDKYIAPYMPSPHTLSQYNASYLNYINPQYTAPAGKKYDWFLDALDTVSSYMGGKDLLKGIAPIPSYDATDINSMPSANPGDYSQWKTDPRVTQNLYPPPKPGKQEITPYGYNNMGNTYIEQDGDIRFVPWYEKRWKSVIDKENQRDEEEFWKDPAAFMEANRDPWYADETDESYAAWLDELAIKAKAATGTTPWRTDKIDTYIDQFGDEWDSKDQWESYQQSMQDYVAGLQPPKQESIDDATRRLAAQMAEGGERPVSYYQELLRQSYKTFEDLANAGTDFNRFPTDVTPNKWIEDNNTFLPSMMGKDNLPMSGFGANTPPNNDDLTPWNNKPRPPGYFDKHGSFRTNNPLRNMGDETLKSLPMGQLGVSDQIQLRRDLFMGADLDKLSDKTKAAIYESFDMGWHPGLGDDEEDNSRMGGIFEAITGFSLPESDARDGEYDTNNYAVEGYPLMEYINSPESGLPNLADYLVPTGQDDQGRMTFEGDYYKWEQDFRKAWRDNPGLFRDTKLHPEFLPEWANPRYRDNSGE